MTAAAKLLVASSDGVLRDLLSEQLGTSAGCEAMACATAEHALALLQSEVVDLVIVDTTLSDMAGAEFLDGMRQEGFRGPAIHLVPADLVEGGADPSAEAAPCERLSKPLKFASLLSRIRTLVRAFEASEEAAVPIGPFQFRFGAKTLINPQGERLKLTEKETAILRHLHRAGPSTVVTRDELLQDVFGYTAGVETHTLETHVYRLRQKIESDPAAARILLTEPGGYRLQP